MKLDLGLLRFALPENEDLVPMMFIAMGEKDEGAKIDAGPTMAKVAPAAFRRTLTINFTVRGPDETPDAAIDRTARELLARVKGKKTSAKPLPAGSIPGQLVEFGHEGQRKMALHSVCWVGCHQGWVYTINFTGLDGDKSRARMLETVTGLVKSAAA